MSSKPMWMIRAGEGGYARANFPAEDLMAGLTERKKIVEALAAALEQLNLIAFGVDEAKTEKEFSA